MASVQYSDVAVGDKLPKQEINITSSLIVTRGATLDWSRARSRGYENVELCCCLAPRSGPLLCGFSNNVWGTGARMPRA